jgi:hypothetical protein
VLDQFAQGGIGGLLVRQPRRPYRAQRHGAVPAVSLDVRRRPVGGVAAPDRRRGMGYHLTGASRRRRGRQSLRLHIDKWMGKDRMAAVVAPAGSYNQPAVIDLPTCERGRTP